MDESFIGSVRLLINTGHPVGRMALVSDPPEGLDQALTIDILRRLILEVSTRDMDLEADWPDGSIGDVLTGMCDLYFSMPLKTAVKTLCADPGYFEDHLAASIDPFRKIWSK